MSESAPPSKNVSGGGGVPSHHTALDPVHLVVYCGAHGVHGGPQLYDPGGDLGRGPQFTLKNYAGITEPVYLSTFWESLKLAVISTVLIIAIGYPFGYFMAKLGPKWKKRTMLC